MHLRGLAPCHAPCTLAPSDTPHIGALLATALQSCSEDAKGTPILCSQGTSASQPCAQQQSFESPRMLPSYNHRSNLSCLQAPSPTGYSNGHRAGSLAASLAASPAKPLNKPIVHLPSAAPPAANPPWQQGSGHLTGTDHQLTPKGLSDSEATEDEHPPEDWVCPHALCVGSPSKGCCVVWWRGCSTS